MVVVAQARASLTVRHRRRVGIGGADAKIGRAPVGAADNVPVGTPGPPDPVMPRCGALGQIRLGPLSQDDWQSRRLVTLRCSVLLSVPTTILVMVVLRGEEVVEVRLDGEPGLQRREGGI